MYVGNMSLKMHLYRCVRHFHASAKGGYPKGARPTTGRGCIPGVTPNMIIARMNSIAPPPPPPSPPQSSHLSILFQDPHHYQKTICLFQYSTNWSALNPLCVDILAQPIQLPCSTLACAQCIIQWVVTTASVHCPCCFFAAANSSATPSASFTLSTYCC